MQENPTGAYKRKITYLLRLILKMKKLNRFESEMKISFSSPLIFK